MFDCTSAGSDIDEYDLIDANGDCERHSNPLFDLSEDTGVSAVMQVVTRSKARSKAPSEMERLRRLRRDAKDAKVRSACAVLDGPIIDSASDTDVIGARDAKSATNVLEHKPFLYKTISGTGETKLRGDLKTPLVTLCSAPIVMSSQDSIVSHETLHGEDYTIVSDKDGTTLQRDGVAIEAVPSGKMYRLPVVPVERVDDEVNYAVNGRTTQKSSHRSHIKEATAASKAYAPSR